MTTYIGTPDKDAGELMSLEVLEKETIAEDIAQFVLAHPQGAELPAFSAGSHVLVVTPKGVSRRYSLCNSPAERHRYVIAVKREVSGKGGSASMFADVRAGTRLEVSHPFNYFPLFEEASSHLLIAAGIGITPILAMARELAARDADFQLVYCTRSPGATAYLRELSGPQWQGRVRLYHDDGTPPGELPFAALLATRHGDEHLYCCGPRGLMDAVRQAASHWPASALHFEDFGTHIVEPSEDGAGSAFEVRLARTGGRVPVPPNVTILEALRRSGMDVPSSCESGTCGTCRTRLLAGVADHRDVVLDEDEQQAQIMICVSRARSPELVLDL